MALIVGARQLPPHHITIRVPWHDGGWTGRVCDRPLDNTSCLILPRIGEGRRDQDETRCAGQRLDEIGKKSLPPCVGERVSFMAPFELTRKIPHPYRDIFPETHGHLKPARFVQPAYSAACAPYRWTLREKVEGDPATGETGLAERLRIGWIPEREPDIRNRQGKRVATAWIQERENQRALLDTFFSALRPHESLCFFYAKRTPLSDQSRRVIVGVGRVLSVSEPTEYGSNVANPPLRAILWERNVGHSVRPGFTDGFLFPYREALALAEQDGTSPEEFVAFAPDEHFDAYSYGSELLPHDGAVASLVTCAATLHRIRGRIEGPWDEVLAWIDSQLNRLWKARGVYPGLGSALSAFGYEWGFQHGTLLAYEIELMADREGETDPWALVDAVMEDPSKLHGSMAKLLSPSLRRGWQRLTAERRALLQLLARCALSENQALRLYDATERNKAGIELTDADLVANSYLLFEGDRCAIDPIAFQTVDRGVHPADDTIRTIDDPADQRRVRALAIDLLDEAAREGHTLLPRSWLISRARERALQPPCPLGENVLDATEEFFGSAIEGSTTRAGEPAYQLDRLVECRTILRKEVLGRKRGQPHEAVHDWRRIVNEELNEPLPKDLDERELEERARTEKAAALEQMFRSRLSTLIGSAGTGKTTLLKMLCSLLPEQDVLLLAPTGKARVRLEDRKRLVVLHQGPLAAYRGFATDEHSEIARRMTNLFVDPQPREVMVGRQVRFLEDGLIHRTESGDLVRSKSEVIIADKLFARGVDYAYEQPLTLPNGRTRYPDFTIADPARGVTFYWEHLGLLDDPAYQARWERKRAEYLEPETGIKHWQEPGDSAHILVETRDQPGGGIDSTEIARLIDEVVMA